MFGDVDNDGDLDILSVAYQDGTAKAPAADDRNEEVFLNDGRRTSAWRRFRTCRAKALPGAGPSFVDFDRDGVLDLFLATWYDPDPNSIEGAGNYLYRGLGGGRFSDVSVSTGVMRPSIGLDEQQVPGRREPARGLWRHHLRRRQRWLAGSASQRIWPRLERAVAQSRRWHVPRIGFKTPVASDDNVSTKSDNQFYLCYCKESTRGPADGRQRRASTARAMPGRRGLTTSRLATGAIPSRRPAVISTTMATWI